MSPPAQCLTLNAKHLTTPDLMVLMLIDLSGSPLSEEASDTGRSI
jgi:hypothetical protein